MFELVMTERGDNSEESLYFATEEEAVEAAIEVGFETAGYVLCRVHAIPAAAVPPCKARGYDPYNSANRHEYVRAISWRTEG